MVTKNGYKTQLKMWLQSEFSQSATCQSGNAKDGGATFASLLWIAKQLVCACNAMGDVVSTIYKSQLYAFTVPRHSCA